MVNASNVALRKAFDLNANLETQTERGVSCPGGVRFERPPLPDTTIQRASSESTIEAKEKRRFRRLDPHFDSYEGSEGM